MYLCDAIDGAQFEDPQDQSFEDAPEQHECFEEGKLVLDHIPVPITFNIHIYFIYMPII
jgi:hypothetical protein